MHKNVKVINNLRARVHVHAKAKINLGIFVKSCIFAE
jgi:hypothetical protein